MVFQTLPRDEEGKYEEVKATILYGLEITLEHYCWLFWAKKSKEDRRPRVLLQLLRDIMNK